MWAWIAPTSYLSLLLLLPLVYQRSSELLGQYGGLLIGLAEFFLLLISFIFISVMIQHQNYTNLSKQSDQASENWKSDSGSLKDILRSEFSSATLGENAHGQMTYCVTPLDLTLRTCSDLDGLQQSRKQTRPGFTETGYTPLRTSSHIRSNTKLNQNQALTSIALQKLGRYQ